MTTNNDATRALQRLNELEENLGTIKDTMRDPRISRSDQKKYVLINVNENGEIIRDIRTSLLKSAQVDGLVTALKKAMPFLQSISPSTSSLGIQMVKEALHKFSATEI